MKTKFLVLSRFRFNILQKCTMPIIAPQFQKCLIFLTTISRLNCPPLQDYVSVEWHRESWIERENDVIYLRV